MHYKLRRPIKSIKEATTTIENSAYHPNNRNHPNFSYANLNNALMPPPVFSVTKGVIDPPKPSSSQELSKNYMEANDAKIAKIENDVNGLLRLATHQENIVTQINNQLAQIGQQLAMQHKKDQFLNDTIINSKDQCNAIHLRCGTQYLGPKMSDESDETPEKAQMVTRTATTALTPLPAADFLESTATGRENRANRCRLSRINGDRHSR